MGHLVSRAQDVFTGKVAVRLSELSLSHFQNSSFQDYVHTDSSVLVRRIALEPFEFAQQVLAGTQQVITQLALISISVAAILIYKARLFLLLLLILAPPSIIVFYVIKSRMTRIREKIRKDNERSYKKLLDALKGYVESNIFQRNDFFLKRFMQERREFGKHLYQTVSLQAIPSRIIEVFAITGLFLLLLIANWNGHAENDMLLTIGAFMAAAYKMIPGLVKIINLGGQIKAYNFQSEEWDHPVFRDHATITRPPIHTLELKQLGCSFGEKEILRNISFKASEGELIGISGVSGRGKTTLVNVLLGLMKADQGTIEINGIPHDEHMLKQLWPSVAYMRQQHFLINDTITRNITLEDAVSVPENLESACQLSGVSQFTTAFPERMEKVITENGKNISGGQQQRIALARTLYKQAELIMLDEPFNELDEASGKHICMQLKQVAEKGKIILLITHDKQILNICHKIISLDA